MFDGKHPNCFKLITSFFFYEKSFIRGNKKFIELKYEAICMDSGTIRIKFYSFDGRDLLSQS